jgi:hypothetical protein
MRLTVLERGHTLPQKLLLKAIGLISGFAPPDVVRTLLYRKGWFGAHMSELTEALMRGPSEWTVGERELMAAFVSRVNQCPF